MDFFLLAEIPNISFTLAFPSVRCKTHTYCTHVKIVHFAILVFVANALKYCSSYCGIYLFFGFGC